jgi:hypothetical protein
MIPVAHQPQTSGLSPRHLHTPFASPVDGQVVECCAWCRRPAKFCRLPSCDSSPVYSGVLAPDGQWLVNEPEM